MELKGEFLSMLSEALGEDKLPTVVRALDETASVSLRLNPFKSEGVHLPILEGSTPVEWSPYGRMLRERPVFTLHPLFHSGVYYVQDSSAMYVGSAFRDMLPRFSRLGRPLRVLDLCAAPGGKTTDLAASLRGELGDGFILVSNEVMRNRATVLADNVGRWGDPCVVVTCADPSAFAKLDSFFDIIVADVPCSGEGMFRKDAEALAQWSPENVKLCAERQRRIVADVWPSLAPGGVMIYSTCTFNNCENDGNVDWICASLGAEKLSSKTLVPGFVPGEGQYCAVMLKNLCGGHAGEERWTDRKGGRQQEGRQQGGRQHGGRRAGGLITGLDAEGLFDVPMDLKLRSDMITAVPQCISGLADTVSSALPLLSRGCAVGTLKGKDLVPDEDLALCIRLRRGAFEETPVDKAAALAFLHKDALVLPDSPRGIVMLTYKGVPLGFVKNLGNRTNSLHPQARRIRMDIK